MNVLGLPLSFQSSKEKKAKTTKGKRKNPKKKILYIEKDINDAMLDVIRFPDEKFIASGCINDELNSVSMLGECGVPCPDISLNANEATCLSNGGDAFMPCIGAVSDPKSDFNIICERRCLQEIDGELNLCPMLDNERSLGSSMVEDGHGITELYQDLKDYKVGIEDAQSETLHKLVNTDIVCAYEASACCQSTEMVDCNTVGSEGEGVFGDPKDHKVVIVNAQSETLHNYVNTDITCSYETTASSQSMEMVDCNTVGEGAYGNWRACWDEYYGRSYFFNVITLVSTWDPPPEVIDFDTCRTFVDGSAELIVEIEHSKANSSDSGESVEPSVSCVLEPSLDMSKEPMFGNGSCGEKCSEFREIRLLSKSYCDNANKKKKNKARMLQVEGILHSANEGRYRLFENYHLLP